MIFSLRKRIHELAGQMVRAHVAPPRVAAAVLLGCIVGCTPLFGLHIFICIALAWLLRLNQVIVYGAANLSVPPMIPLVGFASVQLGERMLHGRWLSLSRAQFAGQGARRIAEEFFFDWMLGGMTLGAVVGLIAGGVVWRMLVARRPLEPIDRLIRQARDRYDGLHPRFKWYARMKYVMDPCYRAIAPLVPEGAFAVDLGTGLGMLPVLLGLLGQGRRALGIEWDAAKVACGVHAARSLDVQIVEGDVHSYPLPPCDVITLVDMLHYYDAAVQQELLRRCREALRPGGRLLVREGDRQRDGGARWTRVVEKSMVRLGWNRGPDVKFRPIAELRADLEALGFRVRVDEVAGKLHPGNVLLVADL
jgi:uncharacterized protein (DUF2062 family)